VGLKLGKPPGCGYNQESRFLMGGSVMHLPEFLSQDTRGYIHLLGHRVGLDDVIHFYAEGESPEMLHLRFPTVPLPLLYKIIAFYLENQAEVDAYRQLQAAEIARQREVAPTGPSLDELRRRREAKRLPQGA
jgi:uncharacterized protein (DUF433 family)